MDNNSRKDKVKLNVLSYVDTQPHFHQDIELIYILEGTLDVFSDDQTTNLKSGDILVINSNKKHTLSASTDLLYMQLLISYSLFSEMFNSATILFLCNSSYDDNERYDKLRVTLRRLLNHYLERHGETGDFEYIALCYQVLDLLSIYFMVQSSDKENVEDHGKFEERIAQINNYIWANYNQPIGLKDLCDKLYLSNGYLSRFFKRNYGMSFAEYLTNIRLFHAVDDLLYTNANITKIAYDNGFANVAVFNKAFKKVYGETPSSMRKKNEHKDEKIKKNPEIEDRLEKYLILDQPDQQDETDINVCREVCSAKQYEKMPPFAGKTINIGMASELLNSEVQAHVLILKQLLDFKYVRFWNIFSQEMLIDLNAKESYNFSRLDIVIDFLLSVNLKPHIDFSMKPKYILYRAGDIRFFDERQEDYQDGEFVNPEIWQCFMEALMQHLVRRYGRQEVDTWRLEYWYAEGRRTEEYFDTFLHLYDLTHRIAKSYSEGMEVGGFGFRLDYGDDLRMKLLERWKENHCRPDFFSAYVYNYVRGKENDDRYAKVASDNDFYMHKLQALHDMIKQCGFTDSKIYVTEWNVTPSVRNYINDSCFRGAYLLKNTLDTYGLVDDVGYYIGTDRSLEYFDSSDMIFGGCGLLSKDSIMKPAAFAIEFMNQLYPYCVSRGKNFLISADLHDDFAIICHNQRMLSYNYFFARENELEKEHFWKYFEDRHQLSLELELKDVTPGLYQMKSYRINDNHGSIMSVWQETEYEHELSRDDIKYLRRMCEPKLTMRKVSTEGSSLEIHTELAANEILLIRIRRIG